GGDFAPRPPMLRCGGGYRYLRGKFVGRSQRARSSVSVPELALGLAFLLLVANAARRGFLREGSLLLGLGLALWLDGRLYRHLGAAVQRSDGDGPWLVVVYVGLALVLMVAAAGLSSLAAPLVRRGPLRVLDRTAGLAVGLAEA